jgi:hypothetical protein
MTELTGNLDDFAKDLGLKVLNQVKDDFGGAWDGVKDEVKDTLALVSTDAGRLAVKKMAGFDVAEEEKHIHAQLLNLKVAGEVLAVRTFWESFEKVMGAIGTALGAIAKAGLKVITGGAV